MGRNLRIASQLATYSIRPANAYKSSLYSSGQDQRRYASVPSSIAEAPISAPTLDPHQPHASPISLSASHPLIVKASVLVSRPPLLLRDLTPFERAYFLYQRRLNERLALPFTRYFYYQRGTPGDIEWKRKIKERRTPARDIGTYTGYGEEAWNDEVILGERTSEPEAQLQSLLSDADDKDVARAVGRGDKRETSIEKPLPRTTGTDASQDLESLNRSLTRTLYLVVSKKAKLDSDRQWLFPTSELGENESLHMAAERVLVQAAGMNMNTWIVGNMPVGHQVHHGAVTPSETSLAPSKITEKVFYMKAHIMAGQANLKDNELGLQEFRWLTKQELQRTLSPRDFSAVKKVLADR